MTSCEYLVEKTEPQHLVQLHEADGRVLTRNVGRYLSEGLKQGDGLVVIATRVHREAFARQLTRLGWDLQTALRERRVLLLDAEETLAQLCVNGQPNWDCFERTIERVMRDVQPREGHTRLRAYGEMVGVLWKAKQFSAAIQLEEFWNKLLKAVGFKLFCAYPIDVFGDEFHTSAVDELLCAHTHLVPCGEAGAVESALDRAMEEIIGPDVQKMKLVLRGNQRPSWAAMPEGESTILSLRSTAPQRAGEVLSRARQHYQSERRFRALVENSSDAISLLNAEGTVLYASASTLRVLGYQPEEITGRDAFELVHSEDVASIRQAYEEIVRSPGVSVQLESRMLRKDGSWCWIESTISNLLDEPDVRAIVSNYRDISERKAAEEDKLRHADDLARSNGELKRTNDDLNQFAYSASHDLQEPLRMMAIYSQMLERKYKTRLDTEADRYISHIVSGAQRMDALLKDLLAYTRAVEFTPGEISPIDANAVVATAMNNLDAAIRESGAEISCGALPLVRIREAHLLQVFQNLIGNAIKYRSEERPSIDISAGRQGASWEFCVRDNGIGIPPQYADQIFGIFKRLHSSADYDGTGIGLAICQRIVERYGGRIWVESPQGNGSIFRFTLPAHAAEQAA